MIQYAEKLRGCIARFERLRESADPELARVYAAEIAANRAMLTDIEQRYALQPHATVLAV